ncbi:MAG: C4-dicarboxylate ABC transporter [Methylibium sp. NZG]|nr:MAG: C4-dicarboxylate ABC transporter [Methylibium sp. NZG]
MSTNVTRRRLLAGASAVSAAAWAGPVFAQNKVTLVYSDIVPENDSRSTILRNAFSALGPDFDFKAHHGGTLFKQGTEAVAIQRGNLDMANIASGDVQNQVPQLSLLMVPYLIRDVAHLRKLWASDVGAELNKLLDEKMGLRILSNPYIGTRHLGLRTTKKIMKPADLAGVKLRMPPGEVWQFVGTAMGANPTPLPFPEVYTALQTGAIDAQDNALPAVKNMKFFEVSKQISLTGHLVAANHFVIGSKKWAGLSADQQRRVQAAASKAEEDITNMALKDESELVDFFKAQGLDVYSPDVAAFRSHVLEQYAKSKFAAGWVPGMMERIAKL